MRPGVCLIIVSFFAACGSPLQFATEANYEAVFDITQQDFNWQFPARLLGIAFLVVVVTLFLQKKHWIRGMAAFNYSTAGLMFLIGSLMFMSTYSDHLKDKRAYEQGRYRVAEGRVERLRRMPPEGGKRESFVVCGVEFTSDNYGWTRGLNYRSERRAPVHEGMMVRIAYANDGTILKLEVEK